MPSDDLVVEMLRQRVKIAEQVWQDELVKLAVWEDALTDIANPGTQQYDHFVASMKKKLNHAHPFQIADEILTVERTNLNRGQGLITEGPMAGIPLSLTEPDLPEHALVSATKWWSNLGLRKALIQAVERGADYISIASGETVDMLNMGTPVKGALYAYNVIYPKAMTEILKKIDKEAAESYVKTPYLRAHDFEERKANGERAASEETDPTTAAMLRQVSKAANTVGNTVNYKDKFYIQESDNSRSDPYLDNEDKDYYVYITGKPDPLAGPVTGYDAAVKELEKLQATTSGGNGFHTWKLTDKVKETVRNVGMPMMARRQGPPDNQLDMFDMTPEQYTEQAKMDGFDTDRLLWRVEGETGGAIGARKIFLLGERPQGAKNAVPVWVRGKLATATQYSQDFGSKTYAPLGMVDPDTNEIVAGRVMREYQERGPEKGGPIAGIELAVPRKGGQGYITTMYVAMFNEQDVREAAPRGGERAAMRQKEPDAPQLNTIIL